MTQTAIPDNKIRLSPDVLAKAEEIAQTWGLKNSRAAVEAVFRKYADEYNSGREYRRPDPEMPQTGGEVPAPEPIRCECRSLTSDATVAIWYHGDGDGIPFDECGFKAAIVLESVESPNHMVFARPLNP